VDLVPVRLEDGGRLQARDLLIGERRYAAARFLELGRADDYTR
jgi:hypothetical protein